MNNPLSGRNPPASTAGKIAALLLLIVVAFKGALAAGAPCAATQGGSNVGVLPDMLRVGSWRRCAFGAAPANRVPRVGRNRWSSRGRRLGPVAMGASRSPGEVGFRAAIRLWIRQGVVRATPRVRRG
jgi:hypothetical protein